MSRLHVSHAPYDARFVRFTYAPYAPYDSRFTHPSILYSHPSIDPSIQVAAVAVRKRDALLAGYATANPREPLSSADADAALREV